MNSLQSRPITSPACIPTHSGRALLYSTLSLSTDPARHFKHFARAVRYRHHVHLRSFSSTVTTAMLTCHRHAICLIAWLSDARHVHLPLATIISICHCHVYLRHHRHSHGLSPRWSPRAPAIVTSSCYLPLSYLPSAITMLCLRDCHGYPLASSCPPAVDDDVCLPSSYPL